MPLICAACTSLPSVPENVSDQSPYVVSTVSVKIQDFIFDEDVGHVTTPTGEGLRSFLTGIGNRGAGRIRLISYSEAAFKEAMIAVDSLHYPHDQTVFEQRIRPAVLDARVELQIEFLRHGLAVRSCRADNDVIQFGCAVEINRALSLVDPAELDFAKELTSSAIQYEERVFRRYLQGPRIEFSDRSE